jgi:hypothetical protein
VINASEFIVDLDLGPSRIWKLLVIRF